MIERIDHVSLAVPDYGAARRFFETLFGAVGGAEDRERALGYGWHIFSLGDLSRLELIYPSGPTSFLDGFLARHPNGGLHHITLQVASIEAACDRLTAAGIPFFGRRDLGSAWRELFIHPRNAFGVLIQLAEFQADDWLAPQVRLAGAAPWQVEPLPEGCRLRVRHPGGGHTTLDLTRHQARAMARALESASGLADDP